MHLAPESAAHGTRQYALNALESLPCGCVAGVYKARLSEVEVVAVEARGPHCLHSHHRAGRVIGLASAAEAGWIGG